MTTTGSGSGPFGATGDPQSGPGEIAGAAADARLSRLNAVESRAMGSVEKAGRSASCSVGTASDSTAYMRQYMRDRRALVRAGLIQPSQQMRGNGRVWVRVG